MTKYGKNKVLLAIGILLVALSLILAGCGGKQPEKPAAEAPKQEVTKYPEKTVMMIVPWPAGGRTDTTTRTWAPFLEKELGVPVVVANHPGGGGVVGASAVARAKADGYTLGVFSISLNLARYTKEPPFNLDDFAPLAQIYSAPITMTVKADSPWKTMEEFMAYAKANPGKIKQGTSGKGTSEHVLSAALFKQYGIEVKVVPYTGDAPAVNALVTGEVDLVSVPMVSVKPHVAAGALRVLGISKAERDPNEPTVRTFKEAGFDFVSGSFEGVYAPKGTPPDIVKILEGALKRTFENPELKAQLVNLLVDPDYMNAEQFSAKIRKIDGEFAKLTEELGVRIAK